MIPEEIAYVPDSSPAADGFRALWTMACCDIPDHKLIDAFLVAPLPGLLIDGYAWRSPGRTEIFRQSAQLTPMVDGEARQLAAFLAARGRALYLAEQNKSVQKAVAAAEHHIWQSGLLGKNEKFDGGAYAIMLDALDFPLPEDVLNTALFSSNDRRGLSEGLKRDGFFMKLCLDDPGSFLCKVQPAIAVSHRPLAPFALTVPKFE